MANELLPTLFNEEHGDDLARAGTIADAYARQHILVDYQQTTSANTKRRRQSELKVFSHFLAAVNRFPAAFAQTTFLFHCRYCRRMSFLVGIKHSHEHNVAVN